MDVLLVAHGYPPDRRGGTELLTAGLAGELARAGHGVRVLAAAGVAGNPQVRDTTVESIPVRLLERPVPADYQLARADAGAQRQLELLIEEERPDVVHVQHTLFLGPEIIGTASRRAATVVSLHDFWAQCPLVHTGPRDHHPVRGDWWGAACFMHYELRHPLQLLGEVARGSLGATVKAHLERPRRFPFDTYDRLRPYVELRAVPARMPLSRLAQTTHAHLLGLAGQVGVLAVAHVALARRDLPVRAEFDAVGRVDVDTLHLAA